MTYKFRYIRVSFLMPIVVFLSAMIVSSCGGSKSRQERSESEFSRLRDEGLRALNMGNFDLADSFGDSLLNLGTSDPKLTDASIYGNILKGQASIFKDSISPAYSYLHDAEALCLRYDNNFALASVYNGLGIYSENIEKDNNEALRYFFLGLDAAKKSDNARLHSLLLCNIASIYHLTENPMGLRYALECYNHGKKTHDEFLHYIGSLSTAYSHMIRKEYEPALKFIREAEMVLRTNNINNGATLYCLYGMILRRTGNEEEATDAFLQSIKYMKEPDATDYDLRSYIELAEMLREKKRIGEAIEVLEDGLKISDTGYNNIFRSDFLEVLSHTYRVAGDTAKADKYEKIRESEQTSVENRDNEIAIEHIRTKYDLERVENELNRQHIELLENQNAVYVLVFVAVLFLILLVFSIFFYRRKHKLYKTIVANMTESAREEQRLRDTISRLEDELQNVKKGEGKVQDFTGVYGDRETKEISITHEGEHEPTATSAPDEYAEASDDFDNEPKESPDNSTIPAELYQRLRIDFERLMTDKSVYTDNLITKEKIARRLGTNRTYFSRFINDCYKMSFTRLVNSFRIKEAVRLLSDPDISLPLKTISEQLGFNSQSTFYSQFQEATGMTPAAFRNKACRLPNL